MFVKSQQRVADMSGRFKNISKEFEDGGNSDETAPKELAARQVYVVDAPSVGSTNATNNASTKPMRCNYYWRTGQCKYGDQCKFRHVANPNAKSEPSKPNSNTKTPVKMD